MMSRGEGYNSSFTLSFISGDEFSWPRLGRFTPGKDPVPVVREAGWAPGPVWTGAKNLASTRFRSLDRPARSESPYRLSCHGRLRLVRRTDDLMSAYIP